MRSGHGSDYLDADIQYHVRPFVADWTMYYWRDYLVLWLRGGSSYTWRSKRNRMSMMWGEQASSVMFYQCVALPQLHS